MKRVILTIFLILVLSCSVFSASFSDVPASHWAYDAVKKLASSGIISGYSDGTFKGKKNLSRYEIAVIVARVLDEIKAEQAVLSNEIESVKNSIKNESGEMVNKKEVNKILKSIINKNTGKTISDKQADEIRNTIQSLTYEFKSELKEVKTNYEQLASKINKMDQEITRLKAEPKYNVKIHGNLKTIFETTNYGDDEGVAEVLWADTLDLGWREKNDVDDPYDDYLAKKSLYQELNLNLNTNVQNFDVRLALDTFKNVFSSSDKYGTIENDYELDLDKALLKLTDGITTFRAGNFDHFIVEDYFVGYYADELPKMKGVELTSSVADTNVRAFMVGEDEADYKESPAYLGMSGTSDYTENDYYGLTGTKNLGTAKITGKLYQARIPDKNITDLAVAVEGDVTEAVKLSGELVANSADIDNGDNTDDILIKMGTTVDVNGALTLNGQINKCGEDFAKMTHTHAWGYDDQDVEGTTYAKLGSTYVLNANNTLSGHYKIIVPKEDKWGSNAENENGFKVALNNVRGAFTNTAAVEFIKNDAYTKDADKRIVTLGTEYAMSNITALTAKLVNKNSEGYSNPSDNQNYTYLKAGINHKLYDNVSWNTEAHIITGSVNESDDVSTNALKTEIVVSF